MYNHFMSLEIKINENIYKCLKIKDNIYSFKDDESESKLFLFDDGIIIKRHSKDHDTIINLHNDYEVRVISECGNYVFPIKIVEKSKNNDIFIYAYKIDGNYIKVEIKDLGE